MKETLIHPTVFNDGLKQAGRIRLPLRILCHFLLTLGFCKKDVDKLAKSFFEDKGYE